MSLRSLVLFFVLFCVVSDYCCCFIVFSFSCVRVFSDVSLPHCPFLVSCSTSLFVFFVSSGIRTEIVHTHTFSLTLPYSFFLSLIFLLSSLFHSFIFSLFHFLSLLFFPLIPSFYLLSLFYLTVHFTFFLFVRSFALYSFLRPRVLSSSPLLEPLR